MDIEYKERPFGDVVQDMIYSVSENTYEFMKMTGVSNIKLSNFVNHKSWPGIKSLQKLSQVLPEEERQDFVLYFMNKETKQRCISILRDRGIKEPYSYAGHYDKELIYSEKYSETNKDFFKSLRIQGLFKYLSDEEKVLFKESLIKYLVKRNEEMKKVIGKIEDFKGI